MSTQRLTRTSATPTRRHPYASFLERSPKRPPQTELGSCCLRTRPRRCVRPVQNRNRIRSTPVRRRGPQRSSTASVAAYRGLGQGTRRPAPEHRQGELRPRTIDHRPRSCPDRMWSDHRIQSARILATSGRERTGGMVTPAEQANERARDRIERESVNLATALAVHRHMAESLANSRNASARALASGLNQILERVPIDELEVTGSGGLVITPFNGDHVVDDPKLVRLAAKVCECARVLADHDAGDGRSLLARASAVAPHAAERNTCADRIMPARIATLSGPERRAGRLFAPYSPGDQPNLPGFSAPETMPTPVLPLVLYDLGVGKTVKKGSHGTPLALRLFVESVLSVPHCDRGHARIRGCADAGELRIVDDRLLPPAPVRRC